MATSAPRPCGVAFLIASAFSATVSMPDRSTISTAPAALAWARRPGDMSAAMTDAPRNWASRMYIWPMGPAPLTTTVSPIVMPDSAMPCTTVDSGSSGAAASKARVSGIS